MQLSRLNVEAFSYTRHDLVCNLKASPVLLGKRHLVVLYIQTLSHLGIIIESHSLKI